MRVNLIALCYMKSFLLNSALIRTAALSLFLVFPLVDKSCFTEQAAQLCCLRKLNKIEHNINNNLVGLSAKSISI